MGIKKIPVKIMLDILSTLYNKGLDYVDFHTVPVDEVNYELLVSYDLSYMSPEYLEDNKPEEEPKPIDKPISDEDINLLI